jgi:multidrug efflux pump subunit AcrA (membrane-fusion protein)
MSKSSSQHPTDSHLVAAPLSWREWLWQGTQYMATLSLLCGAGWWGHHTQWNFGLASPAEAVSTERPIDPPAAVEPVDPTLTRLDSPQSALLSGIETGRVEQAQLQDRVPVTGEITYDPRLVTSLAPRVPGTVWRVLRRVGDSVATGDVMALIDAAGVGQAKADFLSALVTVESKQEIVDSYEKIPEAIPERQRREARIALREARIQLLNAQQLLTNLGFQIEPAELARLSDVERVKFMRILGLPTEIAQEVEQGSQTSNLLPIWAPQPGVVTVQDANRGQNVAAETPVFEIADLSRMSVRLHIPKEFAGRVQAGQPFHFHPDGSSQKLEGELSWISTEVNPQTRTLEARAIIENGQFAGEAASGTGKSPLRAHIFGRGAIVVGSANGALAVPSSAVVLTESTSQVYVRTGELEYRPIPVSVGVKDDQLVQVHSDQLQPGQEVVVRGGHILKSELVLKGDSAR